VPSRFKRTLPENSPLHQYGRT